MCNSVQLFLKYTEIEAFSIDRRTMICEHVGHNRQKRAEISEFGVNRIAHSVHFTDNPLRTGRFSMPATAIRRDRPGRAKLSLYSASGERKYINAEERQRFLEAAGESDPLTRSLCLTLVYTGCRLSEALMLSPASVQQATNVIAIPTLKKRGEIAVREIPVPPSLIGELTGMQDMFEHHAHAPFWHWKRTWAWSRVKHVMEQSNITGLHASPKGLRHGYGVHAVHSGVPLNLVQKWLGHAQLSTTAIYTNAVGSEEYAIAERMWENVDT